MNLLLLNFEKGWRGGERQTLYAMQGFRDASISCELLCRKGFSMEKEAKINGFRVHSFNSVFGVIFFLITHGHRFDFLLPQTSHLLTYCVFTKFFFKSPIFFTRRVDFVPKGSLTKLKYKHADRIIAISEAIKKIVSNFSGRNDIVVISDIGVKAQHNVAIANQRLASLNLGNKHIVATTAALTGHKDPLTAVAAIKKLSAKRQDFVFLHFGSGELHDLVALAISENNLHDFYKLMGFVENVENFFSLFEVFVMTSEEEGLGSSVLDAFLNKVPVVSTDAGGLKELLGFNRGILCNVKDSDAIADGINSMLNNVPEKQKCVKNAYDYASHYHSMKFITEKYIDLMKNYATNRQ